MGQFTSDWLSQPHIQKLIAHDSPHRSKVSTTKPKRDVAPTLVQAAVGETKIVGRVMVRFTGYRVRPVDPDSHAASCKYLLDGLRESSLLENDTPWDIDLQADQVKVGSFDEEKTVITIEYPRPEMCPLFER